MLGNRLTIRLSLRQQQVFCFLFGQRFPFGFDPRDRLGFSALLCRFICLTFLLYACLRFLSYLLFSQFSLIGQHNG